VDTLYPTLYPSEQVGWTDAYAAGWRLVQLKELGFWVGGGTPSKAIPAYWETGSIPWVSPKDMKTERIHDSEDHITEQAVTESTTNLIPSGAVLMVTRSGILRHTLPVAVTTIPVTINQDLKALSPKEGILAEYVAWALRAFSQQILDTCSKQGTTVNSLETSRLLRFEIPVAPLDQQKRIVAEIEKQFSRLDEAVANLKRVKANLKRYKAAVLKAAVEGRLVETEAERARREGRSYETGKQLLQRILETRRSQWQGKGKYKEPVAPDTTDLPELPEGWVWAISNVVFDFVTSGSRGWAKYYSDSGSTFLRVGNLDHGTIDLDLSDIQRVEAPMNLEADRSRVKPGDLLISITAELGMVAVVPEKIGDAYINQHVAIARSTDLVNKNYIGWFFACEHAGKKQLESLRRGATKAGLGLDDIRSVYMAMPPVSEQQRIVAEVDRRLSLLRETEAQVDANLKRAERLRQSILRRAFSGELLSADVLRERVV